MNIRKEEYNNVPVLYCKHCLSLKIRTILPDIINSDYCDECGSTDIGETSIEEWEKLYKEKFGHKYLDKF